MYHRSMWSHESRFGLQAMCAGTAERDLIDVIITETGYDPYDSDVADDFRVSTTEPCDRCGNVTLTAMLSDDFDGIHEERVCADCCVWGL